MKQMNIALCTDWNLVDYVGVLMTSIAETNCQVQIHFFVLHEGSLKEAHVNKIINSQKRYEHVEVSVIGVDLPDDQIPITSYPKATFLRMMFPKVLPNNVEIILYLDIDMVVMGDIYELYCTPLENSLFGVVIDEAEYSPKRFEQLEIPQEKWEGLSYFNCGMMLIDLTKWREEHVMEELIEYMSKHRDKHFPYADQDVFNLLYRNRAKLLPIQYNLGHAFLGDYHKLDVREYFYESIEEARNNPIIVHLYWIHHPWYKECYCPYAKVWLHFARKCPYRIKLFYREELSLIRKVKRTIKNILIKIGVIAGPELTEYGNEYLVTAKKICDDFLLKMQR